MMLAEEKRDSITRNPHEKRCAVAKAVLEIDREDKIIEVELAGLCYIEDAQDRNHPLE